MMMRFQIDFTARRLGALGIFEQFSAFVIADSQDEAIRKLYEHYEHIHMPQVTELIQEEDTP